MQVCTGFCFNNINIETDFSCSIVTWVIIEMHLLWLVEDCILSHISYFRTLKHYTLSLKWLAKNVFQLSVWMVIWEDSLCLGELHVAVEQKLCWINIIWRVSRVVNPRALTGSFFLDFAKWIVSIPENSHMPCISGCQKPIKFKNSIPTSLQIAKKRNSLC